MSPGHSDKRGKPCQGTMKFERRMGAFNIYRCEVCGHEEQISYTA